MVALATALTGCAKDSDLTDNPVNPASPAKSNTETVAKQPVLFGAYVNRATTRAGDPGVLVTSGATAGQINLQEKGFGVISYYTDDDMYSPIYQPNFMYNTKVTHNGSAWTYEPVQYWPNETGENAVSEGVDRLSFFAYAPYVDVTPSTGVVTGDNASGIVGLSRNGAVGDPWVKYYVSLDPAKQVDFSWAVPQINMVKPAVSDVVNMQFNHALAALNVQVDAMIDESTPGNNTLDANTKIYVRSVTFEGLVTKGSFNLNSTKATWYDLAGANYIDGGSVTVYDGRTNGKEGQSESANESPVGLNPVVVQSQPYSGTPTAGVTNAAVNLFAGTTADAPIYVIPSGQPLTVTIVYDVETATDELSNYLSDGLTHGTSVENKITKTISFGTSNKLEAGKLYKLTLHLGMTSVKFDATVAEWDESTAGSEVGLPDNIIELGNINLSQTSANVWIGQTITKPTVTVTDKGGTDLTNEATITWSSNAPTVASVSADGDIEVVGAGEAVITVTATYEEASKSADYTVYVNEVTGISVDPSADSIKEGAQKAITAILTHTNYGTITSWPVVSWVSDDTSLVTVDPSSATAANNSDATLATTTATGSATSGTAHVTATVSAPYAKTDVSATATLTCMPARAYFRGYDVSAGILMRTVDATNTSVYSLTDGSNPFELADYYNKNDSKNKYYFQFAFLKGDDELGADGNNINASSTKLPDYNPDDSSEGKWNMPTGLNKEGNSWYDIIRGKPKFPIQIEKADGSVETISAADKGTAFVEIEKDGKYYYGLLLLRDGSYIPKEGKLQYWGYTESRVNKIKYDQYLVLKEAGCLFLCSTGYYSSTFGYWRYFSTAENDTGGEAHYWSANYDNGKRKVLKFMRGSTVSPSTHSSDNYYIPVRLVKKMN